MRKIPKYKGLRVYLVAFVLYYMLISPMSSMLYVTNFPKMKEYSKFLKIMDHSSVDSLETNVENNLDSLEINIENELDSLGINIENELDSLGTILQDTILDESRIKTSFNKQNQGIVISTDDGKISNAGYFDLETLFFKMLIIVFLLGFLFVFLSPKFFSQP